MGKCTTICFRGSEQIFYLQNVVLNSNEVLKDLGIHIHGDLCSQEHLEHRVKKQICVLYLLRPNFSTKIATKVKLGHHNSVIRPVLVDGLQCVALTKTDLTVLYKNDWSEKTNTEDHVEIRR